MNYVSLLCLFYIIYMMIFNGNTILLTSQNAIKLWIELLIPSLFFPTLCLRLLFDYFPDIPIKFLNIDNLRYLIIGWCFGYPNFAIYLDEQCQKGQISSESCTRLLYCINTCSLPFLLVTIASQLQHPISIVSLSLSLFLSNLFLLYMTKDIPIHTYHIHQKQSFISQVKYHMLKIATSLFFMGGYILICYSIFTIVPTNPLITMYLEFSSGTMYLLQHPSIYQLPLLGSILAFGSISIHLQTFSSLNTIKIRYTKYLMYRILQTLFTILLLCFFQFFF